MMFISFVLVVLPLESDVQANNKNSYLVKVKSNHLIKITTIKQLEKEFYRVYPILVNKYNHNAPNTVIIEVKKNWNVPASASNNKITFDADFVNQEKLAAIEVLSHELMHVVQLHHHPRGIPSWLVEGMATYAQLLHGPPFYEQYYKKPYQGKKTYKDGYEQTAIFLFWIKNKYRSTLFEDLNRQIVEDNYSNPLLERIYGNDYWFKILTGKTVGELWTEFSSNRDNLGPFNKCNFRRGHCIINDSKLR